MLIVMLTVVAMVGAFAMGVFLWALTKFDINESRIGSEDPFTGRGSIDMVVTWAGPSTPIRKTQRQRALAAFEGSTDLAGAADDVADMRIADNGELVFLLERAARYGGDWLRYLHIVCPDGTRLPREIERAEFGVIRNFIKLCPESKIMPHQDPVFNSHAFEANLDRVPGLSEEFLYACDDMWLNGRLSRDCFFDDQGRPRLLLKPDTWPCLQAGWSGCPVTLIHHSALHRSASMVCTRFPGYMFLSPKHHVHSLTRAGFKRARQIFPKDFDLLSRSSFRCAEDFHPVSLVQNLLRATLDAVPQHRWVQGCLINLYDWLGRSRLERNLAILTGKLQRSNLLCVNDHCNHKTRSHRKWMRTMF